MGAGFHPIGVFFRLKRGDRIYPGATRTRRANLDIFANNHTADTHGPEKSFVTCIYQHIDTPFIHRNRNDTSSLASVQYEHRISFTDNLANSGGILKGAHDIRCMIDNHHTGVGLDAPANLFWINETSAISADSRHRNIVIALKVIGGAEHTVMLHAGDNHVVARIQDA